MEAPTTARSAARQTFTERGTFVYFCLFHDAFGMMGTVNVI
ncbi:MAG TPA: plastocyanin/azurin family copper-binding protein [Candidatus Baltobacteraceae bacterium]|nr:plastocyanin/azurin family copper-binding protein [Candidatus Baltobacteraceae bacterium]